MAKIFLLSSFRNSPFSLYLSNNKIGEYGTYQLYNSFSPNVNWTLIDCSQTKSGLSNGWSRRGILGTVAADGVMFSEAVQDGCELTEAALHSRRSQLYIPKQRDCNVFASDLLERSDGSNGVLADPCIRYAAETQTHV